MNHIADTISTIRQTLPDGVNLVAVSKYHPESAIEEAYAVGQRIFGESHVQELTRKYDALPKDIEWHFIGHLQTNKVKYLAPFVSLIHAVDSLRLLTEINRQAARHNRIIDCLIQVHIAQEETKFGFTPDELLAFMSAGEWRSLANVRIVGLMCMASNTDDEAQISSEFESVHQLYLGIRSSYPEIAPHFVQLSMGMSDDYPLAIQHGSTLIRIGSKIFGNRVY